jgi:hypothetical protein
MLGLNLRREFQAIAIEAVGPVQSRPAGLSVLEVASPFIEISRWFRFADYRPQLTKELA